MKSASPGVMDALFGDLDDSARQRFGMVTQQSDAPDKPEVTRHPAGRNVGIGDLSGADVFQIGKATVARVGSDRVTAVAGGITFFGLLSLFPGLTALVSMYGLIADRATISGHLDMLERFIPSGALSIIRGQVEAIAATPGTALSLAGIGGLLIAFYSANGGMKALLSALNVAFFQTETRGFIRLNLVAMCFTLGGFVMIILMLSVIAVIPILLQYLPMAQTTSNWVGAIRWPIMFSVLVLALAALYRWGPDAPSSRWRWISPGAIVGAVGLVVISVLFSWYAANFANYNETYGSLGAVIALMMWLWLASTVVLVGAELNAEIEIHLKKMAGVPVNRVHKGG